MLIVRRPENAHPTFYGVERSDKMMLMQRAPNLFGDARIALARYASVLSAIFRAFFCIFPDKAPLYAVHRSSNYPRSRSRFTDSQARLRRTAGGIRVCAQACAQPCHGQARPEARRVGKAWGGP